ncbi:hypothetical protein ABH920_002269 [Catenulispora sp. EB89]
MAFSRYVGFGGKIGSVLNHLHPIPRRVRRAVVAVVAAALAFVGIAGPADAHVRLSHQVDITAVEPLTYDVDTHGVLAAGVVHLRFENRGADLHQAQLFRLNDGVTFAQWQADIHGPNANAALFADGVPTGGANPVVPPHGRQDVWDVLRGGTYVVTCFVPGPGGVPHIFLGMYKSFDVQGTVPEWAAADDREAAQSSFVIRGHDLTYTMPPYLVRGTVVRFEDTDAADDHEVNLGKLLPGKTVDDAKAWFVASSATPPVNPGPPPFTFEGGHGAVAPGHGGWFKVQADPGRYIAFCLVPDDQTGLPHAAMGMVVGVTVLG